MASRPFSAWTTSTGRLHLFTRVGEPSNPRHHDQKDQLYSQPAAARMDDVKQTQFKVFPPPSLRAWEKEREADPWNRIHLRPCQWHLKENDCFDIEVDSFSIRRASDLWARSNLSGFDLMGETQPTRTSVKKEKRRKINILQSPFKLNYILYYKRDAWGGQVSLTQYLYQRANIM
jgi:hypothetical protein